ncbi:hypothetical protein PHYBLDRAFT_148909 [Phycomyces blakesleeanus NRRL 1555(-)]|uniref:Stretch-activated cation channel Mid1 n=1 Tax=Phycomyces blakesleeanus (strain ATCC 8743b / DSM 1359 / FGSC 10004 / NBRC 33097 / NRRL 1555) TaxID=763407 RepID=A0A167LG10_PHYB8|nr:hypothetical protein PHYBLDRAFT_148909 [Phycomyces blakesleeanus NRRL 1555(-)]OAD70369.1 hypothetical protein PHYBLDRAFT_148909 [Phycomyces blakesleeanus NRRL 1555(-)]|eukprot:XP_018288409.1 hypothetical protein PHYBLDRAFT_148909 [Phycomyces blakesleeanus NRRL 1555(-)]
MLILVLGLLLSLFSSNVFAQAPITIQLNNSQIISLSIDSGDLQHFYFPVETATILALSTIHDSFTKRDISPIYLTLTSCSQPTPPDNYQGQVPSLDVFLSLSNDNTLPGPSNGIPVNGSFGGRTSWEGDSTFPKVWIGVVAPTLNDHWTGSWTFEIGISTQQWMHPPLLTGSLGEPAMVLDDTDTTHALFLTSPYESSTAPNVSLLLAGHVPTELMYSLCAIKPYQITNFSLNTTLTSRGPSVAARQQLYVSGLTGDAVYIAYLLETQNGQMTFGPPIEIQTKSPGKHTHVYPENKDRLTSPRVPVGATIGLDTSEIASNYDTQAKATFDPFGTALSQFNCEKTQYSLVRNCNDCYMDYKRWLCSVTIPRCTSALSSVPGTQASGQFPAVSVRSIPTNRSRNPWIDQNMTPGPWVELLPCIDLCYRVVQSCPPFLQFNCPIGDLAMYQYGYWQNGELSANDTTFTYDVNHPTCNRNGLDTTLLVISEAINIKVSGSLAFIGLFWMIWWNI